MKAIQSYLTTIMRGRMNTYEVRVLLKIVQRAQKVIGGQYISKISKSQIPTDALSTELTFSAKELLKDHSHHYTELHQTLEEMEKKVISYYDNLDKTWRSSPLVQAAEVNHETGTVRLSVSPWLYRTIVDFSHGFSRYDLQSALQLTSANTVRLYMLTSNLKEPFTLSISYLRMWLGIEDNQYKLNADFIKRCLLPAAAELEKQHLNGYNLLTKKTGRKITHVTFVPVKREEESTTEVLAKMNISDWVSRQIYKTLVEEGGFLREELNRHKSTIIAFSRLQDWDSRLAKIIAYQRRRRADKGYIIKSMKNALQGK